MAGRAGRSGGVECLEWTIPDPTAPNSWAISCRVCGEVRPCLTFYRDRPLPVTPATLMAAARADHAACLRAHEERMRGSG